jgi:hypothetical protein
MLFEAKQFQYYAALGMYTTAPASSGAAQRAHF